MVYNYSEICHVASKKSGVRHVLSWVKRGQDPKFHDSGFFGG